jgi:DNA-binding beta-propeller fold protein YncE
VTPESKTVFVTNSVNNTVSTTDVKPGPGTRPDIPVRSGPAEVAVTPSNRATGIDNPTKPGRALTPRATVVEASAC